MKYYLVAFGLCLVLGLNAQVETSASDKALASYTETGIASSFKMLAIPAGTFIMGCTSEQQGCDEDEQPAHEVTLSGFYMSEAEVTQAQWKAVMGTNPGSFSDCDDCPVGQVSYEDIQTFLSKLNAQCGKQYRLPTEAEWEYAARGGEYYLYGGSNTIDDVAWYASNSSAKLHPVKGKRANGYGLYDMTGNVYEWCNDLYSSYHSYSQTNPTGGSASSERIIRGGSFEEDTSYCPVTFRNYLRSNVRSVAIGFRIASSQ